MKLTDNQLRDLHDHAFIRNRIEVRLIPDKERDNYKGETIKLNNCDFSLGFAVRIDDHTAVTVNAGYLKAVHLNMNDIWRYWMTTNTDNVQIIPMNELIAEFGYPTINDGIRNDLIVVKYDHDCAGAACVLHPEVQKKILKRFPEGFNILFSSVYEAIVTPAKYDVKSLAEILHDANATPGIIQPCEIATDYVYACHIPAQLERMVI